MILDQANRLRQIVQEAAHPRARTLTVTSGKGGVGKTNLAINLAIAAAAQGQKVIVLDADLGLANIDLLLNVRAPLNLSHVINGTHSLLETIVPAPGQIQIVPGASGLSEVADLSDRKLDLLIESLEQLESAADWIVIDTGAGISRNIINFARAADEVLVVATPEPTAITDAYATIKTLAKHSPEMLIRLLINMADDVSEAERVAEQITQVCQTFLGVYLQKSGAVLRDSAVSSAVRQREPFLLAYPHSGASRSVQRIAKMIFRDRSDDHAVPKPGFFRKLARLFRGEM